MSHALVRTSPKGKFFVGRCVKCGEQNLQISDAAKDCPQDHLVSDEAALINVIKQEDLK